MTNKFRQIINFASLTNVTFQRCALMKSRTCSFITQ